MCVVVARCDSTVPPCRVLTRDITMVLNLPQIREEGDPHCHTFPHHDGKYVHSKSWVADLRQRFNAAVDALDNDGK